MHGFLNLEKPAGISSRAAVNVVQRLVRPAKVGHAGTLDPLAQGVLVVAVGKATRLIEYVHRYRKGYQAEFMLGRQSPTDDIEGEITLLDGAPEPNRAEVDAAASRFVGQLLQVPPAYSAVKVGGKRSYRMARQGRAVELAPRPIVVFRCDVIAYNYPKLKLEIECGTGTYIRAIGRDLAAALGTHAVMTSLVRTFIGPFCRGRSIPVDTIDQAGISAVLSPMQIALQGFVQITVDAETRQNMLQGREVSVPPIWDGSPGELAALDESGQLVGILVPASHGQWRPIRCFASQ
jgi:tRNA pseudouridine55 synthase